MVSPRDAPNLSERPSYVKNVIMYNFDTVTAETKFHCSLFTALVFLGEYSFSSSEHRNKTSLFSPSFSSFSSMTTTSPRDCFPTDLWQSWKTQHLLGTNTVSSRAFIWRQNWRKWEKKKKGSAQPQQILQTVFLFADLGGFHNNDDHNRRNEDFTKHGDWTTESIICNRRAHEPLLMAFTESPAQMIFTLMSEHSTLETHMP